MIEDMWEQIGRIVEDTELENKYRDALGKGDWRQAHFLLFYAMVLDFEKNTKCLEEIGGISEDTERRRAELEDMKRLVIPIIEGKEDNAYGEK